MTSISVDLCKPGTIVYDTSRYRKMVYNGFSNVAFSSDKPSEWGSYKFLIKAKGRPSIYQINFSPEYVLNNIKIVEEEE